MKYFLSGISLVFALVTIPQIVHADRVADAKKAFVSGGKFFEAKDYTKASEQFRNAYDIRPNWKILYNIAQSEAAAKNYGVALEYFERYLADGGDEIDIERTNEVLGEIERMKKMVGYLEIGGAEPELSVYVDGNHRGDTPLSGPLALTAGAEHLIAVKKADVTVLEKTIRIPSGQTTVLSLAPEAPAAEDPSLKETSDETETEKETSAEALSASIRAESRRLKIAGWSVLSVGVGTLIAATVTGGMAVSKNSDLEPQCEGGCPQELAEEKKNVDQLSLTTDVLIGVGAAIAVTGVVLLAVGKVKEKKVERAVALFPGLGIETVGLTLKGEF